MRKLFGLCLLLFSLLAQTAFASGLGSTATVIQDTGGDKLSLTSSGLANIHDADHHRKMVNEYAHLHTGATSISIQAGAYASFAIGDHINLTLAAGSQESDRAVITAKPGSPVLTLDKPLDIAYAIGDLVEKVDLNLASTTASLAAPRIYTLYPPPTETWHLIELIVTALDNLQPDDGNMFGTTAFTNGIVVRENKSGVYRTLAVWKSNQDIISDAYNVEYRQKSGGGDWGTRVQWHIRDASGAIVHLNGAAGDKIEFLVQDNPTALISILIKMQGHLEE